MCVYPSRHVLSTECDLSKAPRRKTDGSIVLDTEFYAVKLYAKEGGSKLIRRRSGAVERQLGVFLNKLPIAYRLVHMTKVRATPCLYLIDLAHSKRLHSLAQV